MHCGLFLVIQIGGVNVKHGNGAMRERELSSLKKRRQSENSEEEEEDSYYGTRITEERYRSMLGEHIQKYKRRFKDTSASPASTRMGIPAPRSNLGLKARKLGNEHRGALHEVETTSDWLNDTNSQKQGNYHEADIAPLNGTERFAIFYCCFMRFFPLEHSLINWGDIFSFIYSLQDNIRTCFFRYWGWCHV